MTPSVATSWSFSCMFLPITGLDSWLAPQPSSSWCLGHVSPSSSGILQSLQLLGRTCCQGRTPQQLLLSLVMHHIYWWNVQKMLGNAPRIVHLPEPDLPRVLPKGLHGLLASLRSCQIVWTSFYCYFYTFSRLFPNYFCLNSVWFSIELAKAYTPFFPLVWKRLNFFTFSSLLSVQLSHGGFLSVQGL